MEKQIDPQELRVRNNTLEEIINACFERERDGLPTDRTFFAEAYGKDLETLCRKGSEGIRGIFSVVTPKRGEATAAIVTTEEIAHIIVYRALGATTRISTFDFGDDGYTSCTFVKPEALKKPNVLDRLPRCQPIHDLIDVIGSNAREKLRKTE